MVLVTAEQTLVGKEFHARGPATEALSLRHRLVWGGVQTLTVSINCKQNL